MVVKISRYLIRTGVVLLVFAGSSEERQISDEMNEDENDSDKRGLQHLKHLNVNPH